ncbi:MAG: hydantoinase/oxoprolinase family protein, partial [Acholeplasmataceae bacterium]
MILGLDMGGTNIDAVIIKNNTIVKSIKRLIDYNDVFNSIYNTIFEITKDINRKEIKKINLSTTISTNKIALNDLDDVGLIIQTGPGLNYDFLKLSKYQEFIKGYTDHRGVIVKDFDINEINTIKDKFKNSGITNVGIISKFSTRNPETENKIKELIKDDFNSITLGHELSGKLNFYRRINTCFLNESIKNNFTLFSNYIEKSIKLLGINSEINILKADGGIMSLKAANTYVAETIFSGPSASLMGMLSLKKYEEDSILIDIGGTTTDIFFLADGIPLFEPLGTKINKYKTLIRSIFSKSLPLGGNTAFIIEKGTLKIDFKSLNKLLSLGGEKITLTDVFNYLNNLNIGDTNKSIKGLKDLSKQLNLDVNKTSK